VLTALGVGVLVGVVVGALGAGGGILSVPALIYLLGQDPHDASAGSLVVVAGQVPLDPATGALVEGDIQAQAEQVLKNVGAILAEAGLGYDDVVKTTVLLADIADFAAVNEVYARYFTGETLPARAAFGVAALPLGAGVEIEAIAARS